MHYLILTYIIYTLVCIKFLSNCYIHIRQLFCTARPGMLDLKGKAKWDAWKSKDGMSQNDAKEAYIKFVDTLVEKYK